MTRRTDLAVESCDTFEDRPPEGVTISHSKLEEIALTDIRITSEEGAKAVGKPIGRYVTVELPPFGESAEVSEKTLTAIGGIIREYVGADFPVLVAGLGNSDITPDALGPMVASGIFSTRHITNEMANEYGLGNLRPVCAIAPGVLGQTGIETGEIISCVAEEIEAGSIIAVDAFAASNLSRLGCTIQISDTGISPGSGVQNARKEISPATMKRKVVAIGIPTVVDAATIVTDLQGEGNAVISENAKDMVVTPRDVDLMIKRASHTISMAINLALQPSLSADDIQGLVS